MLPNPFEKQLHLPTRLVERSDGQRRHARVVGQKYELLTRVWIFTADASQVSGIVAPDAGPIHGDGLITDHTGCALGCGRVHASGVQVALGAGDEEGASLMQPLKP